MNEVIFFFKQKTAYEIYQCDWSSDVCSSDLGKKVGLLKIRSFRPFPFYDVASILKKAKAIAVFEDRKSVV